MTEHRANTIKPLLEKALSSKFVLVSRKHDCYQNCLASRILVYRNKETNNCNLHADIVSSWPEDKKLMVEINHLDDLEVNPRKQTLAISLYGKPYFLVQTQNNYNANKKNNPKECWEALKTALHPKKHEDSMSVSDFNKALLD